MTEIPEHLLRRSRERRAALGLGGGTPEGGEGSSAPAEAASEPSAAPAAAAAAAPAVRPAAPVEEAKAAPPKPDPPFIQAAKRRRRIPYWAMSVLLGMPLWAYVYVRTLEPPPAGEDDPLVLGAQEYSQCASCHGADGSGSGNVPGFVDGQLSATFPDWRDHAMWVRLGSDGWPGETYGAQATPKQGGMPAWSLTDEQLAQVVLHERVLAGEEVDETNEEYADLFAIAHGEMTFADAGLGPLAEAAGVPEDTLAG